MKWIHQYDAESPKIEMDVGRDATLPELLEEFGRFLLAVGYVFDGHLEIVPDEEDETNKEEI